MDDKIKKRMSMRYADISSPTATSVPPLPTVPIAYLASGPQISQDSYSIPEKEEVKEDPREADLKLLDQENFDPDTCEQGCAHASCFMRSVTFSS